jgi:mannose-6-phosphate isomerase-like protein (cupin superfamily)
MAQHAINIDDKFAQFSDTWSPKVITRLNDYEIKLVRLDGEFVWHTHEDTDELFLVFDGELTIRLRDGDVRDGDVVVRPGEMFVVPRGVEHCPVTSGVVRAMLIEPRGVVNTGDASGELTATYDDSLA